jgi:hypothetical protein
MATIGSLLRDRVTLQVRSVDRIFLQAYVPGLQTMYQLIRFLLHRGFPIPSPAALGRIGRSFVADIEGYIATNHIPVVHFAKGQKKDQVAAPYLAGAAAEGTEAVVLVGVAQEKVQAWRGWKDGGSAGHPHFEYRRQSVFVNHYYFYVFDRAFGPAFFKLCPYAPYPVWVWCNGHEWAKRQADRAGLGYAALDNGFAACADPERLQRICDRLSAAAIRTFVLRWLGKLPSVFTAADRQAGFFHDLAFRQVEFSDTRVFDRPASGRAWFESAIREHLDLGRPDQVAIVFSRRITRRTPGRFSTRVITRGVDPSIQIHYRASKLKQYFKEGRALRTETTINDTYDFGVGRLVKEENFRALRAVGEAANHRLVELESSSEACAPDADTLQRVVLPSVHDGLPAPALRFGDPRVASLLGALVCFGNLVAGFTNATLRELVAGLLGQPYSARQMTYDLRRLRRKGFIVRDDGTRRYRLTPEGRRLALFLTKVYARILTPGLAHIDPRLPSGAALRTPLGRAWRSLDTALEQTIREAAIAA